jgi:hypothetical protein
MEKATFRTLCLAFLLFSTSVFSQGGTNFSGQVLYHTNYGLSGVHAYLRVAGGSIIDSTVTNAEGYYEFTNVTPGNYVISFSTQQPEGGVDLNDAFLVMCKILFNTYFTPVQMLAADVNCSGTITWSDYFMILIGYLNQGNPFPHPWVFQSITTPIPVPSRSGFTTGGGSSSGDVNGSLQPDPKSRPVLLESPFLDAIVNSSSTLSFNLTGAENMEIAGMHLVFTIPQDLEVINIESVIPDATVFQSGNHVNITWIDETMKGILIGEGTSIVTISTRARTISRDPRTYSLSLKEDSHFINSEGQIVEGLKLVLPTLNVQMIDKINCEAYPNPFSNNASIEFTLPEGGQVLISLFDQAGRQVQQLANGFFPAGKHNVKIDGSRLFPGVYHYTASLLNSCQNISTGTIIKSK